MVYVAKSPPLPRHMRPPTPPEIQNHPQKEHGKPQTNFCHKSRGFALVISLTLMTFIFLLILSLTTLVKIESASAQQNKLSNEAKQYALTGLTIALGELQKELGPDQRVSATASIKDTNPYDTDDRNEETGALSTDGVAANRQQWTGVWETNRDNNGYLELTFRKWLVSGFSSAQAPSLNDISDSATPFSDAEILLSGPNPVEAGKVTITSEGTTHGSYAYWIGDEGTKALIGPNEIPTNNALTASRPGIKAIDGMSWFPLDSALTERIPNFPTLQLVAETEAGSTAKDRITNLFHDLTCQSYGVLTDTADAGLRKDLTSALYDSTTNPSGTIFEPLSAVAATEDPGGPTWDQLRSWLQIQPNNDGELEVQASTTTQAGLYPILAGAQVYVVPTYTLSANGQHAEIVYNILPAVILWNPYNRAIKSDDYIVSFGRTGMNSSTKSANGFIEFTSFWNFGWQKINIKDGNGNVTSGELTGTQFNKRASFFLTSGRLEPGQAIVYSPATGYIDYQVDNPQTSARLERGFRPGLGAFQFNTGITFNVPSNSNGNAPTSLTVKIDRNASRTQSVQFLKGTNITAADVLQTAVYLSELPLSNFTTGYNPIYETPSGTDPIDTSYASGLKIMLTTIELGQFWPSAALIPPSSRKWLSQLNPRARLHGPIPLEFEDTTDNMTCQSPSYASNTSIGGGRIPIGFSDISNQVDIGIIGNLNTILFQTAPTRENLRSIGQLSQAPLFNESGSLEERVRNTHFGNLIPTYAIGNGRADSIISLDQTERNFEGTDPIKYPDYFTFRGIHHDYSYKLNEALWDDWFFSSVTYDTDTNTFEEHNPRLVTVSEEAFSNTHPAAAQLMLKGAFNVNSVSVEAWKAVLASFYGNNVERTDGSEELNDSDSPTSPILRLDNPYGAPVPDNSSWTDEENYNGYRALDSDQIQDLAEKIVEEIKLRGPFGSLAQFINRMPNRDGTFSEDNNAFRLKGALTSAIDKTDINSELQRTSTATTSSGISNATTEAENGWRTEDLPGWLSQVDILARLGGTLSARSDTFRIRAYGEATNDLTGETCTARCEAIVQRLPEFIASNENSPDDVLNSLSNTNRTFGRRFIITNFRWLNDDQI